jgi:mannosylglucosylglycerate synthase
VVNAYSIYTEDIKPKGFSVIEIDGFVTSPAVDKARQVLDNPDLCHAMVDHNSELGKKFFSYAVLRRSLRNFMRECGWVPGEFLQYWKNNGKY